MGLPALWPSYSTRKGAPWPEDPVARLRWVAGHAEAEPWLPTAAEQDERWIEVVGPAVERQRTNRVVASAMLGVRL
ncbi:hypothetical protein BH18ACT1_BH18ACT1_11840 [soil metagenome]